MIIVLLREYVSENNPYCNGFVHSRVKAYIDSGEDVRVFVLNEGAKEQDYIFDHVNVMVGGKQRFCSEMEKYENTTVCVHFLDSHIIRCLEETTNLKKAVVFVHGYEALHWYQRIFSGTFANIALFKNFLSYVYNNINELKIIRRFLNQITFPCEFVTVSKWMQEQAENAWKCKGKFHWHIIPNFIDSNCFAYEEKSDETVSSMLSIRPFSSGKYGNDITAKFIKKLNAKKDKLTYKITWIGQGILYDKVTKRVKNIENLVLENRMLQHSEIYAYHKKSAIFICPTRQDAQGVSMCEAMASGLIPITLYNTAIPEYLPDIKELECHNTNDMVALARTLLGDKDLCRSISKVCSEFMKEKCGYDNTIKREITLIRD